VRRLRGNVALKTSEGLGRMVREDAARVADVRPVSGRRASSAGAARIQGIQENGSTVESRRVRRVRASRAPCIITQMVGGRPAPF